MIVDIVSLICTGGRPCRTASLQAETHGASIGALCIEGAGIAHPASTIATFAADVGWLHAAWVSGQTDPIPQSRPTAADANAHAENPLCDRRTVALHTMAQSRRDSLSSPDYCRPQ